MNASLSLLGRAGLSLIFIISGWGKIAGYAATQQYMESVGVPGGLLPLVIALELGGGLAILAGAFTRWIAIALAAVLAGLGRDLPRQLRRPDAGDQLLEERGHGRRLPGPRRQRPRQPEPGCAAGNAPHRARR